MGTFAAEDSKFIYIDGYDKTTLLDLNDFFKNKSRIPFHAVDGGRTASDVIINLMDEHSRIFRGEKEEHYLSLYTMFDVLLMEQCVENSSPDDVLEINVGDGALSYHIASIIGALNSKAKLVAVNASSDDIATDGLIFGKFGHRINEIAVTDKPRIQYLQSGLCDISILRKCFNVVVINAVQEICNSYLVLNEAKSVLKNDGRVYCFSIDDNWLLYDLFCTVFDDVEEYPLNMGGFILRSGIHRSRIESEG